MRENEREREKERCNIQARRLTNRQTEGKNNLESLIPERRA